MNLARDRGGPTCAALALVVPLIGACGRIGFEPGASADPGRDGSLSGDALFDGVPDVMPVMGADTIVATGTNQQRNPALVAAGSGFAVVFDELVGGNRRLRVAVLSATGDVVNGPTTIATTAASASFAAATTDGAEIAVVWEAPSGGQSEIWFGRVGLGGMLAGERQLSQATQLAYNASIVWTGAEYGVAWDHGNQNSADVWFARVSAAGALVGSPVQRTNAGGKAARTSPAWTGAEYGVAWEADTTGTYELYFARVSAAGAALGAIVRVTSVNASAIEPSLVWSGSEYGVAWADWRSGTYEIWFQRIDAMGTPIGMPAAVSPAGGDARRPKLLWLDNRYVLAWSQDAQVRLATLSSAGTVLDTRAVANCSPNPETKLALVRNGSRVGVAWSDVRSGTGDVYFRVVTP